MPENHSSLKNNFTFPFVLIMVFFALTLFAGQYFISRDQFWLLLLWQIVLYGFYGFLYNKKPLISLQQLVAAAVFLRLGSALLLPVLSDDVYRFIWDGQLILKGNNPLLTTPDNYLKALPASGTNFFYFKELHGLINHPQFYTCYPPLMQTVFAGAALVAGKSIVGATLFIKLFVAAMDMVAVICISKIIKQLQLNSSLVLLYALNPSVIIEGAGNAHFEVVQVAFMAMSIYFLLQQKIIAGAIFWGAAIVTKLLPLLLLPLFIKYYGFKKGMLFSIISIAFALICFVPFFSIQSIIGFITSLNLYFQNFEFNASIYYIVRQVGYWISGYNLIAFIGPALMLIFLAIYAWLFFSKNIEKKYSIFAAAVLVFTCYYLLATTVHPWYIINLLPFALFSNKKYPFIWLGVAFLSYSAYSNISFKENVALIFTEYIIIVIALYKSLKAHNNIS